MKDFIYLNRTNGQLVEKGYPNSEAYVRAAGRIILERQPGNGRSCANCFFSRNHDCTLKDTAVHPELICEDDNDSYVFVKIEEGRQ